MPGPAVQDVKLGFWIAAGFALFMLVLSILGLVVGKVRGG